VFEVEGDLENWVTVGISVSGHAKTCILLVDNGAPWQKRHYLAMTFVLLLEQVAFFAFTYILGTFLTDKSQQIR